ncbi:MAG: outer membrane protein heavy metal efflux system [Verrucomicrobiota bacterium]|nr:outer membrane protein heavy metal efflux system [Verrucomicrobiota bacterium]
MKLSTLSLFLAVAAIGAPTPPEALVAEIVAGNPELQFYRDEIAAARAGALLAGSRPPPELSLEAGRKRVRDAGFAAEGTAWAVSVSQTFEWPGRLALRKAVANHDIALAELGLARFEAALTARARTLAFGLHAATARAAAAREVADRYAALKEIFLARDPGGLTPLLETRVIEAQELALQRRATDAALAVQTALTELNQLRGTAADTPLAITPTALKFNSAPSTETLLAAARENHFDFRAKKLELEQQGYAVQLARGEGRPAFTVSPYLSQEKAGERETVAGVGLSLPLPLGDRPRATSELAEARRRQAETAVRLAERELEREVLATAAAYVARQGEITRWAPDSESKFREAAALADRHYRLGAVPLATYVELQNAYLDAIESLLATESEALEAALRLEQITGLKLNLVEAAP